jgi:hypothetical protein
MAWRTLGRIYGWLAATRVGKLLRRKRAPYGLAWLAAFIGFVCCVVGGSVSQRDTRRADGDVGHVSLDFSGQWLMGRLLVTGQGRYLYDRNHQRAVLLAAYPREDENPNQDQSDVEGIMSALMGDPNKDAPAGETDAPENVGGPLYPPLDAFLYVPLGLLPPRIGYRVAQGVCILLVFVAGAGISWLTRGHIWWPVATVFLMMWPGFEGTILLGQNALLSLVILIYGWLLVARGRASWAGLVWGLLAYKPVWAMAFFLVPVLTRRWRLALGMLASGSLLALLTLPFVGWHGWMNWLHVGAEATQGYNVDQVWIDLSRDLLSVPRRWLIDFTQPFYERDRLAPTLIGWGMLLTVLEVTIRLACLRYERPAPVEGPGASFVLLGAWLTCFHFMYYDVLLAALPMLLLFTQPRQYLDPLLARLRSGGDTGKLPPLVVVPPVLVVLLISTQLLWFIDAWHKPPGDTFWLFLLWLWCGWRWVSVPD